MRPGKFLLLLALGWIPACSPAPRPSGKAPASFFGRAIDLQPLLDGFAFSHFLVSREAGRIFYLAEGSKTQWRSIRLDRAGDLWEGRLIDTADFSGRTVWAPAYHHRRRSLYWLGDEHGEERINLWRLALKGGRPERLTDVPYIYSWRLNAARERAAYIARQADHNELRLLDLRTGRDTLLARDRPQWRFTWGAPAWRPDGGGLVLAALPGDDERYGNLIYVDLRSGAQTLLTDPARPRSFPAVHPVWIDDHTFYYLSDEDGFRNVYRYDLDRGLVRQVTQFREDIRQLVTTTVAGAPRLLVIANGAEGCSLYQVDPEIGTVLHRDATGGELDIYSAAGDRLLVGYSAPAAPYRIEDWRLTPDGLRRSARFSATNLEKLVTATAERLTFPTFDRDPAGGQMRQLQGYLYRPRNPLPADQAMVVVDAFYGGNAEFRLPYQVLAGAGIYVFSPAPRGSAGYGRDFAALNDGDLGGAEILDLIAAGSFISNYLRLPPSRVGLIGESYGGYAVLRAMTFPGQVGGRHSDFPWGFGISHAGFSDIESFYRTGNVPGWVAQKAGPPAQWRERSPLWQAHRAKGPILLTHGVNDRRVPIAQSRDMAARLHRAGKAATLVEFPGMGHAVTGRANRLRRYRTWLSFLEEVGQEEGAK